MFLRGQHTRNSLLWEPRRRRKFGQKFRAIFGISNMCVSKFRASRCCRLQNLSHVLKINILKASKFIYRRGKRAASELILCRSKLLSVFLSAFHPHPLAIGDRLHNCRQRWHMEGEPGVRMLWDISFSWCHWYEWQIPGKRDRLGASFLLLPA
jgi:hypothetical protein